jgi:hypothetical protein
MKGEFWRHSEWIITLLNSIYMKKFAFLLAAVVVLASCKKKKDDGPAVDPIVGYWKLSEIYFTGNTTIAGTPLSFSGEGSQYEGGYDLKADGTMSYNTKYTLVVNLAPLPSQTIPVDVSGSGTWKREGEDKLILTDQNGVQEYPIKAEGPKVLVLQQDTTTAFGGNNVKLRLEITLRK